MLIWWFIQYINIYYSYLGIYIIYYLYYSYYINTLIFYNYLFFKNYDTLNIIIILYNNVIQRSINLQ